VDAVSHLEEPRFARTFTLFAVLAALVLVAMLRSSSEEPSDPPTVLPFE
jgi:hypothetical protein